MQLLSDPHALDGPAGPALQAAHATFPEGAEMLGGTLKVGAVAAAALERFSTSLHGVDGRPQVSRTHVATGSRTTYSSAGRHQRFADAFVGSD